MADAAAIIEVQDLKISFITPVEAVPALRGVSFRIRPRTNVAIVGESGSGKSVTAQAIMGLLPRNARILSGQILFRDPKLQSDPKRDVQDLTKIDPATLAFRTIRGGRISMVFQEPMTSMSPLHRVGFQIEEALQLHFKLEAKAAKARVLEMLKLVRFPDPERGYKSYPFELSGGLRQRAMIAMALVCRPALLVADEPTTALDVTVQAEVLGVIRDLQAEFGMAVMLITHDMGVVANMADEVVVLYRGEVMESGTREDVFRDPRHPYLKALMAAVPHISTDDTDRLTPMALLEPQGPGPVEMNGARPAKPRPVISADAPHVLEVQELTKTYAVRSGLFGLSSQSSAVRAVDQVNLAVRRGECLALVGESGCGKTTLSKMIMGAVTPDSGRILFEEGSAGGAADGAKSSMIELQGLSRRQLAPIRRQMQYIFQDPFGALDPRMTVYQLIKEPMMVQGIGDQGSRKAKVKELLTRVGLDARFLNRYPHSFSGGQRQRIGIARALALSPKLLILDEPVSALDVSTQAQVLNLLNDLRADLGLTYLFISHNLAVVSYVADRIAVMCRGRLVELGERRQVLGNPLHPYTRTLLAAAPSPDLDHPLDFAAIRDQKMTEPASWPAPFNEVAGEPSRLIEAEPGHFVRQRGAGTFAALPKLKEPAMSAQVAAQVAVQVATA